MGEAWNRHQKNCREKALYDGVDLRGDTVDADLIVALKKPQHRDVRVDVNPNRDVGGKNHKNRRKMTLPVDVHGEMQVAESAQMQCVADAGADCRKRDDRRVLQHIPWRAHEDEHEHNREDAEHNAPHRDISVILTGRIDPLRSDRREENLEPQNDDQRAVIGESFRKERDQEHEQVRERRRDDIDRKDLRDEPAEGLRITPILRTLPHRIRLDAECRQHGEIPDKRIREVILSQLLDQKRPRDIRERDERKDEIQEIPASVQYGIFSD